MKIERYRVERSKESPGWWVVTDLESMIVVRFEEKKFNDTQQVSTLGDENRDAMYYARAMREMTDYLIKHHKNIVI